MIGRYVIRFTIGTYITTREQINFNIQKTLKFEMKENTYASTYYLLRTTRSVKLFFFLNYRS